MILVRPAANAIHVRRPGKAPARTHALVNVYNYMLHNLKYGFILSRLPPCGVCRTAGAGVATLDPNGQSNRKVKYTTLRVFCVLRDAIVQLGWFQGLEHVYIFPDTGTRSLLLTANGLPHRPRDRDPHCTRVHSPTEPPPARGHHPAGYGFKK